MLGEIAKLFDRNFAVAYFLPAAAFVSASHFLATRLRVVQPVFILSKESLFENVTLFLLTTLVVAVMLSVLNRGVVRLLEGYWPFGFEKHLNFVQRWRYKTLVEQETRINEERDKYAPADVPDHTRLKRNAILRRKAMRFPDKPHLILPTAFGNTFRAFETYPRAVYGIDAIPGWFRLLAVVPVDFRSLIEASRARIDLWVNFCFLAALTIVEYAAFVLFNKYRVVMPRENLWWFPYLMLVLVGLGYRLATSAAAEWGNWVKAAFDLYLTELRKKLEFPAPANAKEQRDMWTKFNQVAVYRQGESMPPKITDSVTAWYDSKEWQDILNLAKLHFTKNGLELLLAVLNEVGEPKTKKDKPAGKT